MTPVAQKTYTLGRAPDNDIQIDRPQVSSHHATLTVVSENLMLLEDNDSTNGTLVNGLRIRRSLVDPNDAVLLANVPIDLSKLFGKNRTATSTDAPAPKNNDYTLPFAQLKQIHTDYQEARKALKRGEKVKVILRAGLYIVPQMISAIAPYATPLGILMSGLLTNEEKSEAIEREFQLKYVCPKCKRYLGNIYWESLATQKHCGCGAIWIAD